MSGSDQPPSDSPNVREARVGWLMAGFFVAALAQRLPFLGFNRAEYTDGILMIGRDLFGATYWPPLYTWICWGLGPLVGGDLETAGQLVSMLSGAAAVLPIVWLAGRCGADERDRWRLGAFAGALYLASPMAWRWGVRVMSDALFLALFWGALACLEAARDRMAQGKGLGGSFAAANLLGTLSALTRHQGIFLTPLVFALALWGGWRALRAEKKRLADGLALASLAFWLAWPLTQWAQAEAHAGQAAYRAGLGASAAGDETRAAFLALVNLTESFVYLAPYFFTPLIWLFALAGAFRFSGWSDAGGKALAGASVLLAALILGSQGLFQSFLARYLLPLLPIVLICAARGLAFAEDAWKPWVYRPILLATLAWGILFGLASMVFQRDAFADLKEASLFVREHLPADLPIYSNEEYKREAGLFAIKERWWIGREVQTLEDFPDAGEPGGAVVLISSAYGGPAIYRSLMDEWTGWRGGRVAAEFESRLLPLLPDIMASPEQGHQSPLAWVYRYQTQTFRTAVVILPAGGPR